MGDRWIITRHNYVQHETIEKAQAEIGRLRAEHPQHSFRLHRIKTSVYPKPRHASDCAIFNEPAYPAGPCSCGFGCDECNGLGRDPDNGMPCPVCRSTEDFVEWGRSITQGENDG